MIAVHDPQAPADVLQRGGNFCIHIYAEKLAEQHIQALDAEVRAELGGMLDGRNKDNLALSVPACNGMDRISEVFDRFRETTGGGWYFANVYKNFEDPEDETLLDWWL